MLDLLNKKTKKAALAEVKTAGISGGSKCMYRCVIYFFINTCCLFFISCNQKNNLINAAASDDPNKKTLPKKPTIYSDTVVINTSAAVFFKPDSIQLIEFKRQTTETAFEANKHDGFYQQRNGHLFLQNKNVRIVDASRAKYLLFMNNKKDTLINLDGLPELWGIYFFQPSKHPRLIDMMDIEREYKDYFLKRAK